MAEINSVPITREGKSIQTIIGDLGRHASRMRYLAMAADCIGNGSSPGGMDRVNCVSYLMDTIAYLGELAENEADDFAELDEIMKGEQP